jgi:hypothetical protein
VKHCMDDRGQELCNAKRLLDAHAMLGAADVAHMLPVLHRVSGRLSRPVLVLAGWGARTHRQPTSH